MRAGRLILAPLLGLVAFVGLWELAVRALDIQPFILLAPSRIVEELGDRPAFYAGEMGVTARHAGIGMLIGLVVALVVGAALAASRLAEQAAQPVLILILVAPWVAYFTSIVVWLGPGDPPTYFLVAFVTLPAFVFATVVGLRSADPAAREVLASVDARAAEVLWRLRLPSAMPTIFATARFSVGLALAAAYYAEGGNFADRGLGAAGRRAAGVQNGPILWATVAGTVLLGMAGLVIITVVERVALRWHVSQRRAVTAVSWRAHRRSVS